LIRERESSQKEEEEEEEEEEEDKVRSTRNHALVPKRETESRREL